MPIKSSIFFTTFLILSVFLLNYFFLPNFFGYGLTNEDIPYLRDYKSEPKYFDNNFLIRVYKNWVHAGPNWAHQILYVGVIDGLLPYNWEFTQKLNFIWKVLAAISIFPALWVLTKSRLLATMSAFTYSVLPSSNGSLTINCTGTEYLGVIFLNLFIVSYYFLIKNQKTIKLLILSFLLLYFAIFAAPMRMIPTLALLLITESIIVILGISKFQTMLLRMFIYIVPFYLMFRMVDPGTLSRGDFYNNLFKDLLAGNWQLLITPLAGLGYTLISTSSVLSFGGNPNLSNLGNYFVNFFRHGLIPLFIIVTLILAPVISQKPKRFIYGMFILNFIFLILIYIFVSHYLYIPKQLALPYNGGLEFATIPGILGAYILSIALMVGFEWYKTGMKDKVLLVVFVSPILSLSYIGATWLAIGKNFAYEGPVQRYLTVPAVGVSIFISSILFLMFRRIQITKHSAFIYCLLSMIFLIYLASFSYKDNQYFTIHRLFGEDMVSQKHIQEAVFNASAIGKRNNLLVYYEPEITTSLDAYWFTALNYGRIPLWLFLHKYYEQQGKVNGCIGYVDNGFKEFKKIYKYSNNQATFDVISVFCMKDGLTYSNKYTFNQDDFFAFTLKGDQVVDITKEVLDRLRQVDNDTNPI